MEGDNGEKDKRIDIDTEKRGETRDKGDRT